jgi:hypothetical protein
VAASAKVDVPAAETKVDVVRVDALAAEDKAAEVRVDETSHALNPKR